MKLTPEKLTAFCAVLAETCNVGKACSAVDISRYTAYRWRKELPDFSEAWEEAMKAGVLALEDEAHRRAFDGVDEPLSHQGHITPAYTMVRDDDGNPVMDDLTKMPKMAPVYNPDGTFKPQTVKKYSDTLAIFLLKAHAPEKYRENTRVDLTSSDGSMEVDDSLRAARVAAILKAATDRKDLDDISDIV